MSRSDWEKASVGGSWEIRVRVADTDMMGVVYNSNLLVWFEIGRTELLRARGIAYREVEARGVSLPVTEAGIKIRASARYDDLLRIETRIGMIRSRQIEFLYRIYRGEELLAEGETVHVPLRHKEARAVNVPAWLREPLGLA
jgi:acyl-CoA thioester hydrolase